MKEINELRKIAEAVAKHEPDFKDIHEYLEALRNMQAELSGTTVLILLSRLEQAEKNADTYQTLYEQRAETLEQAELERAKLRNRSDAMRRQRDGYRNQLRKTEQQVQRVREVLKAEAFEVRDYVTYKAVPVESIEDALDGDTRRLADQGLGDNLARTTKNGENNE